MLRFLKVDATRTTMVYNVHKHIRRAAVLLLATSCLFASGCLTTIDDACSSIAESHCLACFSCAGDVDGVSGGELCDVDAESQAACEDELAALCEREARTLQDPFDELDTCEQVITDETCDELVEREALDRPAAPEECERFL